MQWLLLKLRQGDIFQKRVKSLNPKTFSVDPCKNDSCKNGGQCLSNLENFSFTCKCSEGYEGEHCEERGKNIGAFTDLKIFINKINVDFTYSDFSFLISTANPCESSPCKNGGKCKNKGNGFECECPEHYEGTTCESIGWYFYVKNVYVL